MRDSTKTTRTGNIPSPQAFRAAATGIGQTLRASEATGAIRAQRVIDSTCAPEQLKCRPPSYPEPLADQADKRRRPAGVGMTRPARQTTL